jgi:BirA family biotin operon repressor/biotin-[acetyl-CoA-carboxylase] ligase
LTWVNLYDYPYSAMQIHHIHHASVDSTNLWAERNLSTFDPDALTAITSDEQTAGRGRKGRPWHSPAHKNLYLSLVIFVPARQQLIGFSQLAALCIQSELAHQGVQATIKWPNDLLVNQKKIAGILLESKMLFPRLALIIGIGINVNDDLLSFVGQKATSLKKETGLETPLFKITASLIQRFHCSLTRLQEEGFLSISRTWVREVSWMIGKTISIHELGLSGTIQQIDPEGIICIQTDKGLHYFAAGEISLLLEKLDFGQFLASTFLPCRDIC